MAYPTGITYQLQNSTAGLRPISETTTTQYHPIGTEAVAADFNYGVARFIYLAGCASTSAGDFVFYNLKTGATVRAVHGGATSTGPGAVAMSDNVAGQWGWYAVFGAVPVSAATVAADAPLYLTASAGQLDDLAATGDKISGIVSRAATSASFATCQLAYPELTADGAAATLAGVLKITLSAAIEAADAIVVTGVVEDLAGADVAVAKEVLVRTLAVTDGKGDITVTTGTSKKVVNPATGENVAWITTTAAGAFAFSVANDVAEDTLVQVTCLGALAATLKLTFA